MQYDAAALWENFAIAERLKLNAYNNSYAQKWFWRTKQEQEEEYGRLRAFEFKWNNKKAGVKCPGAFAKAYPEADFSVITPKNIEGFLLRDLNGA